MEIDLPEDDEPGALMRAAFDVVNAASPEQLERLARLAAAILHAARARRERMAREKSAA
ncbi:MAG TPA: hypothetical protein PLV61_01410 [Parvularculaceae bacterium]|nr:hypothetical protein [Amphiplicatus sp.]HPE29816.1 hypothetical protein [Parvularculaceae bacterium]HRX40525.1 hypothetical protein [Parvularculaceae bacterium]